MTNKSKRYFFLDSHTLCLCWIHWLVSHLIYLSFNQTHNAAMLSSRGGARHFHLGGPLEGPVLQQGELSMVCVGLSERGLILGGPLGGPGKILGVQYPPGTPLAPPLLSSKCETFVLQMHHTNFCWTFFSCWRWNLVLVCQFTLVHFDLISNIFCVVIQVEILEWNFWHGEEL